MNKDNALQVINNAAQKGSLICFDKANGFPTTELYRTEITQMSIKASSDCYEISKKFMPKKEIVDRIGEAAGVVFVKGETRTETLEDTACGKRTVYTGISQGKLRLSDGSWRTSSMCEYEFDPTLRAMLDYDVTELTAQTKLAQKRNRDGGAYGPTLARAILEYQKVAKQRANTGARLRVVRELVGMPIAFTADQIKEPVLFGRVVQNTDYILQTQEGRAMATAQALGMDMSALFGGKKTGLESPTHQEETPPDNIPPDNAGDGSSAEELAAAASEPDFEDDPSTEQQVGEETEFDRLTHALREYVEGYKDELNVQTKSGNNPYNFAQDELNNPEATEETRLKAVSRVKDYLIAKKVPGVA
jgi:hypothetical protein